MYRYLAGTIFSLLLAGTPLHAAECTVQSYAELVAESRSADEGRQWDRSVALYTRMIDQCASLINTADLVIAYDALAIASLMTQNYPAAIEAARKCLELDNRFNSCMMTAAKAYEGLGDRESAISFARSAAEVGGYDDYSAAVAILAKSYLKKMVK